MRKVYESRTSFTRGTGGYACVEYLRVRISENTRPAHLESRPTALSPLFPFAVTVAGEFAVDVLGRDTNDPDDDEQSGSPEVLLLESVVESLATKESWRIVDYLFLVVFSQATTTAFSDVATRLAASATEAGSPRTGGPGLRSGGSAEEASPAGSALPGRVEYFPVGPTARNPRPEAACSEPLSASTPPSQGQ